MSRKYQHELCRGVNLIKSTKLKLTHLKEENQYVEIIDLSVTMCRKEDIAIEGLTSVYVANKIDQDKLN